MAVLLLPAPSHAAAARSASSAAKPRHVGVHRSPPVPWPAWWYRQAMCIHANESTDWHKTTTWQGYPSVDHGGMQIDVGTWAGVLRHGYRLTRGFPGDPAWATPRQQLIVAWLIWRSNGDRFGGNQWPNTSRICGVP